MKILYLTGGAGQMYCGSCLRDNALASELIARGHDVTLLPVYTPTLTDEPNVSGGRVFFGVVSVSLQFDADTLTPTYRLLKGIPGRSYGLAIARRLGLSADVLGDAERA